MQDWLAKAIWKHCVLNMLCVVHSFAPEGTAKYEDNLISLYKCTVIWLILSSDMFSEFLLVNLCHVKSLSVQNISLAIEYSVLPTSSTDVNNEQDREYHLSIEDIKSYKWCVDWC